MNKIIYILMIISPLMFISCEKEEVIEEPEC